MKNNQKKAVSLKYNHEKDLAPIVSATGKGIIAEEIMDVATKNNIPIVEDPSLVEILAQLQINEAIPEQLYEAVAEVFAFIYKTDRELVKKN